MTNAYNEVADLCRWEAGPVRTLDEWQILWSLFTTQDPRQQEQLCSDFLQLPATRITKYLLEYVYLAVSRPGGPLERAITELCGRSFNTAVQVSWLLLALLQDQPGNQHIRQLRDECEMAALMGGAPSHPHYAHLCNKQQQQQQLQQQHTSPEDQCPAQDADAAILNPEVNTTPMSSDSSAASTPFAINTGVTPFSSISPASSPSATAAAAAAAAVVGSIMSSGSLCSSHRFRDSLDMELMRQTSHQDLCAATAAAAASSRGVTPSPALLQQQQQQSVCEVPSQLPPIRTNSNHLDRTTSSNSSKSPNKQAYISSKGSTSSSGSVSKLAKQSRPSRKAKPHSRAAAAAAPVGWAIPGSAAAAFSSFDEYFAARQHQLLLDLGEGEGVSGLIAASHAAAAANGSQGCCWLVSHEEEPLSASLLLSMPPRSPRHAAGRDSYLATLDFVDALCETSSNLTRFQQDVRRQVLRQCLYRINQEVEDAAEQGVAVRYPTGGCCSRVLTLLVNEAVILNSRDKAPFLLLAEVQHDDDFVDEALPGRKETPDDAAAAAADTSVAAADPDAAMVAASVVTPVDADAVSLRHITNQPRQMAEPVSPSRRAAAAAAQLHWQQQRHKPYSEPHDALRGESPLSCDTSCTGTAAAAVNASESTNQERQQDAAAAAVAAATGLPTSNQSELATSSQHVPHVSNTAVSAAAGQAVDQAAQQHSTTTHGSVQAGQTQDHHDQQQQQQQQQSGALLHPAGNGHRSSHHQQIAQIAQQDALGQSSSSSGSGSSKAASAANASSTAAAATAAVRPPSPLEQQMQEAMAHFRGDPGLKLIRLNLRVLSQDGYHDQTGQQALASRKDQASHRQQRQQQQQRDRMRTTLNGKSTSRSSWKSRSLDDSSSSLGLADNIIRGYSARDDSSISHDSAADDPWLFGEVPADSASTSWCKDTGPATAATLGSSSNSNMRDVGGPRYLSQQQAAAAAGNLISVVIEVIPAPVVVQQLTSCCTKLLLRRRARRMPSIEAIDIIAGKLGSTIPPPIEIGPPLRISLSSSSSSSTDDHQSADQDASGLASPASSAASDDNGQQSAAAAAAAARVDSGMPASKGRGRVTDPATSAAAGAAAGGMIRDHHDCPPPHDEQKHHNQQQQQSAGSSWWSLLWNPLAAWQQQPMQQEQQQAAGSVTQVDYMLQQQQQQGEVAAVAAAAEIAEQAAAVYGERWNARINRIRAASSVSCRPGWSLSGLIVKSGDDCRQELLALQLIREFSDIWAAAGLPLWVRHFEVLVTSNNTALIELIPDATSIHSIKARSSSVAAAAAAKVGATHAIHGRAGGGSSSSGGGGSSVMSGSVSLSDHFFAKWQRGSVECIAAQRRFVESLAGYSLITYLLQVKDRHNGNIMLDDAGHLIHIDFGFMLSNAPGGNWVRFEAAPFKLTREMLEVMDTNTDGQPSELFDYFKVLCIQGFLVARRHRHRIVGLVKIMAECSRPAALHPPTAAAAAAGSSRWPEQSPLDPTPSGVAAAADLDLEGRWQGSPTAAAAAATAAQEPGSSSSSAATAAAAAAATVTPGPTWPCFKAGSEKVVASLEARFAPHLSDGGCVQHVLRLIGDSLDAWSTRQYDFYQRVLNGIL